MTTDTPSVAEIADLLAWARRLTKAGPAADPADRAAYLAAKTGLLGRVPDQGPHRLTDKDTR